MKAVTAVKATKATTVKAETIRAATAVKVTISTTAEYTETLSAAVESAEAATAY